MRNREQLVISPSAFDDLGGAGSSDTVRTTGTSWRLSRQRLGSVRRGAEANLGECLGMNRTVAYVRSPSIELRKNGMAIV